MLRNRRTAVAPLRPVLFIVIAILILAASILLVLRLSRQASLAIVPSSLQEQILSHWEENRYQELVDIAGSVLNTNPMEPEFLFLRAAANYYAAQQEVSFEEQTRAYNQVVTDLRRALLLPDHPRRDEINYLLGKTYYHKGYYYFDLALKYLEAAEERGYHQPDSFEYLGLVSAELGDLEAAIEYLRASHNENGRAIILITIAKLYIASEDYASAREYALRAFSDSMDSFEQEQSLLIAGEAYRAEGSWDLAEGIYHRLFELNDNSADAKFYLGEVYAARGDTVQARVYWREAYRINPRHPGAISRLNS